jgi:thioredoxin reductase
VIGAGPGGLQMGYFLQRSQRDYIILERADQVGAFFVKYPRHRKLISINKRFTGKSNKEFNLRHDWNSLLSDDDSLLVKHYSSDFFPQADDYLRYLSDYASKLQLNIKLNRNIQNISSRVTSGEDRLFVLRNPNHNETYTCHYVIVATGISTPIRVAEQSGSEFVEYYDSMSLNQSEYENQAVLILGRGNSAFETADHIGGHTALIHMMARSRVRLSWSTHYVGDVRAINNQILDTYQLKSLDGLLEADVNMMAIAEKNGKLYIDPIEQPPAEQEETKHKHTNEDENDEISWSEKEVETSQGEEDIPPQFDNFAMREPYDRVIACLGFQFDFSIFEDDTRPLKGVGRKVKYPSMKRNYESTRIPNMYFTGTNTHTRDLRKSSGGFIHGFRYIVRTLHRLLEWRNHGVKWPSVTLPFTGLLDYMVKRMNEMSGPYQMFGALVEVIIINDDMVTYLEEVPTDVLPYLEKSTGHLANRFIVVNLQYGPGFSGPGNDVFSEERATGEPADAHNSNFLHPVLYYYDKPITSMSPLKLPRPAKIHHMVEDFLTFWTTPLSHLLPLRRFLEDVFQTDMREYFSSTCFTAALTHSSVPKRCEDYLQGMGFLGNKEMLKAAEDAGVRSALVQSLLDK